MRKGKDGDWDIYNENGTTTWERVPIAVLMDIRDELKALNRLLNCNNFLAIPWKLDQIVKHTKNPRRKRVKRQSDRTQV